MEVKDQVKRSVSIVDVASLYVNLKAAGRNFKALCPFHTEKTPSFFVMPDKGSFACYGCNRFGDIFTLVQDMENLTFPEALNFIIERFHVPVEKTRGKSKQKQQDYLAITALAAAYFRDNLVRSKVGEGALGYLEKRGIDRATIEDFALGYAEDRWDGLHTHLQASGCDIQKAIELGLLVRNDSGRIYDRFRGRVIFPITSESGTVLAFGGRGVEDATPKYLNSPDTPIYQKGDHLYGFSLAKERIRETKQAVLVEGYFDVISLHRHGARQAVASLGTALTERQIYLLKRFADRIFLFYDSDRAGVAATTRGIDSMFEQNINPCVVVVSGEKDPDDFIRKNGIEAFNRQLEAAGDGFRFLLNRVAREHRIEVPEQKRRAIEKIKSSLDRIEDPVIRDGYTVMAADFFRIDPEQFSSTRRRQDAGVKPTSGLMITPAEKVFIEAIVAKPEFIPEIRGLFSEEMLSILVSRNIISAVFENFVPESTHVDFQKVARTLTDPERARFHRIFQQQQGVERDRGEWYRRIESSFLCFQDVLNRRKISEINREIRVADRDGDLKKVKRLMALKDRFVREQRKYRQGGGVETNQG